MKLKKVMALVHVFEYKENLFQEFSGFVGELLTLDVKEKMKDDTEQKTGNVEKTGQQHYNIFVKEKCVENSSSMIPSKKDERCSNIFVVIFYENIHHCAHIWCVILLR